MNGNQSVVSKYRRLDSNNPLSKVSEAAMRDEFFKRRATDRNHEMIARQVEQTERRIAHESVNERISENASYLPRLLNRIEKIREQGREIIVKDIIFEYFNNALILDKSFRDEHEAGLRSVLESFIDQRGGFAWVKKAYEATKSPLLKAIVESAERISRSVSERKLLEAKANGTPVQDIDFSLNDEEKDALNYDKGNLSIDQISDLVKNKVLTVIKDEKARQQKEEELEKDLEAQAEADGTTVQEAAQKYIIGKELGTVKEGTLFGAIQSNTYKVLLEAVAQTHHAHKESTDDDDPDTEDIAHFNHDDATEDEFIPYTVARSAKGEYNLERELAESDHADESSLDEEALEVDMDLVLAESITKYTLMEVAHTIKLETYKGTEIRGIVQRLMN